MNKAWPKQGRVVWALAIGLTGVMLAGCTSSAGSANGTSGTVAGAGSCAAVSASAYLASAMVVFIGTAQGGPDAKAGNAEAALVSPARFQVIRYLKGSGPRWVTVQTALTNRGGSMVASEDGIQPRAGQRWKIYTTSLHMPYQTSICDGSCVMNAPSDGVNLHCGQEQHES